MVNAVSGYPEDGAALKREAAAHGDEVLDPLGDAVAAMGQQAMISDPDADVDREEVHDDEGCQIFPREEEEGGDSSDVEEAHGDGGDPVDAALLVLATHAEVLLDLLGDFGDGWDDSGQLGCLYRGFFDRGERSHVFDVLELLISTLTGWRETWCKTFVMPPEGVSWASMKVGLLPRRRVGRATEDEQKG
jgi:hypothetical protein